MADLISRRRFAGLALAGTSLAGCAVRDPLEQDLPDMGTFQLAAPITVARNAKKVPPSRDASEASLRRMMNAELVRRFGRYAGGTPFYIALNIDGYSLAPPGIPVVLTPKSILVVTANVWRADPQEKIGGPKQIVTFEGANTLFLGSGLMKDADAQLLTLCRNTAKKVQDWMLENPTWFGLAT